jgi:hypothetical protein
LVCKIVSIGVTGARMQAHTSSEKIDSAFGAFWFWLCLKKG